jgi:WD40 repeat protein
MIYRTDLTGAIQRSDFSGSKGAVNSLAMSPRGTHLLSGGNDKLIRLWNLSNLKEEFAYDWKIGRIERLAWSPDGLRAAAIGSEGALIWDIDNIGG